MPFRKMFGTFLKHVQAFTKIDAMFKKNIIQHKKSRNLNNVSYHLEKVHAFKIMVTCYENMFSN